jgi:hypothetical protein
MFSFPLRISSKTLFCPSLLLFVLWEVHVLFMFFAFINAYILVSNTISLHTGFQHDFPDIWCWCHLTVTRRVTIVEQELLTLPEHLRPPRVFCGVRVARSLVFCVVFCRSLFVLLSFFDLRILITPLVSSKNYNLRSLGWSHFPTCILTYSQVSYVPNIELLVE